jgi:hypothetical protein
MKKLASILLFLPACVLARVPNDPPRIVIERSDAFPVSAYVGTSYFDTDEGHWTGTPYSMDITFSAPFSCSDDKKRLKLAAWSVAISGDAHARSDERGTRSSGATNPWISGIATLCDTNLDIYSVEIGALVDVDAKDVVPADSGAFARVQGYWGIDTENRILSVAASALVTQIDREDEDSEWFSKLSVGFRTEGRCGIQWGMDVSVAPREGDSSTHQSFSLSGRKKILRSLPLYVQLFVERFDRDTYVEAAVSFNR